MIYDKKEILNLETTLVEYAEKSIQACSLFKEWKKECETYYAKSDGQLRNYLKYADARKKLAVMFQERLIEFDLLERTSVCEIILQLINFSDCNDEKLRTDIQKYAWYINKTIKKYDFSYWEVLLREEGEDETDIVRKIYEYMQKFENRIEIVDTFYEYAQGETVNEAEKMELFDFIHRIEKIL